MFKFKKLRFILTALCSVIFWATLSWSSLVTADDAGAFITTWETSQADEQIFIPTAPDTNYDFTIDWGDGTVKEVSGTNPTPAHTYTDPGIYTVSISGEFPRILLDVYFDGDGDPANAQRLRTIEQWGDIEWSSMEGAFAGALFMTYNASDTPDLSNVTSTRDMFTHAESFDGAIGDWDVSNVTDMSAMFAGNHSFNQDIGGWDVSRVTNMENMFGDAVAFNQDIGDWDVANVTNMRNMFGGYGPYAESFNQDLSGWALTDDVNTHRMFRGAEAFDPAHAPPGVELD